MTRVLYCCYHKAGGRREFHRRVTDVDNDRAEIGMTVEMVTRKMRRDWDEQRLIVYGYKFMPAPSSCINLP